MATPRTLNFIEASDNKVSFTVNTGKSIHSRKFGPNGVFTKLGCTYQYDAENNCINLIDSGSVTESAIKTAPLSPLKRQRIEPVQSEFSINQRFEFLDKFTNMVLDGITASAIVCGEGGLGKCLEKTTKVNVKVDDNLYAELKRMGVV